MKFSYKNAEEYNWIYDSYGMSGNSAKAPYCVKYFLKVEKWKKCAAVGSKPKRVSETFFGGYRTFWSNYHIISYIS